MDTKNIPQSGHVFAYDKNGNILFERYSLERDGVVLSSGQQFCEENYPEYHLFDSVKEYRVVTVGGEVNEFVFTKDEEENSDWVLYPERQFLKDKYCPEGEQLKLVIVNRFAYGENDSLFLDNYRMAGVVL